MVGAAPAFAALQVIQDKSNSLSFNKDLLVLPALHGLRAGAEIKISRPVEDKNPVVIARLGRDPSKRTVAFYGHYDVQPAMEREWTTNPFEMSCIDGYYYGRGTSDNKV